MRSCVYEVMRSSVYDVARLHTNSLDQQYHQRIRPTRNKRHTVANVAIARELAGWCWSLAVLDNDELIRT